MTLRSNNLQSADVFYFGPEPTNTACISAITSSPAPPPPPDETMYVILPQPIITEALTNPPRNPASVYVIYHNPQLFGMCRNWLGGLAGPPLTYTYHSSELSTLEFRSNAPPATKVFEFADLPCPPTRIAEAHDAGAPYFPILAPIFPPEVSALAMRIDDRTCMAAAIRDPPVYGVFVKEITKAKEVDDDEPIPR